MWQDCIFYAESRNISRFTQFCSEEMLSGLEYRSVTPSLVILLVPEEPSAAVEVEQLFQFCPIRRARELIFQFSLIDLKRMSITKEQWVYNQIKMAISHLVQETMYHIYLLAKFCKIKQNADACPTPMHAIPLFKVFLWMIANANLPKSTKIYNLLSHGREVSFWYWSLRRWPGW